MYTQIMKLVFCQQFQYRENILIMLLGNFMYVYIQTCIWSALLRSGSGESSYTEMMVYVAAVFLLLTISHTSIPYELSDRVRSGAIAIDLIRPISLKWNLFFRQLSENTFQCLFTGIPVFIYFFCLGDGRDFLGVHTLPALVSFGLAVVLIFYFQYTVGLLVFWFKEGTYAGMLINGLMELFSGRRIPLWFYPGFLRLICNWLPVYAHSCGGDNDYLDPGLLAIKVR